MHENAIQFAQGFAVEAVDNEILGFAVFIFS